MIYVTTPSGSKTLGTLNIRTPNGDRAIERGSLLTADGDVAFFKSAAADAALSVDIDPIALVSGASSPSPTPITSQNATATADGGVEPYSFAWTKESDLGGSGTWSIGSPGSAVTRFTHSGVPSGETRDATFKCVATDARGRTGEDIISVSVQNFHGVAV